jgi:lipid II:glycine glycyltransferase (peptidoglycan interpeptide bridge formation enzyme)
MTGDQLPSISVEIRDHLDVEAAKEWDALVSTTEMSDVSQLSAWSRLRRDAGFTPLHVLAWKRDELVGGAQILARSIPLIGRIGYLPYGPVHAPANRGELTEVLGEALVRCASHLTALFVQPPVGGEDVSDELLRRGFRSSDAEIAPAASLRLDLNASEDRIRRGLNKRLSAWTKRWPSRGVTVREGDERDIESFAQLMADSAEYQGFEPLSTEYLMTYIHELAPGGFVKLFVGEITGRPVAARMYTVCGGVMKARLAGMERIGDASRLSVPAAVEWRAILWAKSRGIRWFDSGGVRRSSAELLMASRSLAPTDIIGPDWFKASFGGVPYVYPPAVEMIASPVLRSGYDLICRSSTGRALIDRTKRFVRVGRAPGTVKTTMPLGFAELTRKQRFWTARPGRINGRSNL